MPESEKSEPVGEPGSQPGPGKEHFEKFKIGTPEEELKRSRGPEWRSEIPDIRMKLEDDEERHELEKYLESLRGGPVNERYDSGRSIEATLARHYNPETLLSTVRLMRLGQEILATGGEMPNDYVIGRITDILEDRKIATGRTFENLLREGLVQELDDMTKTVINEMRREGRIPETMRSNIYLGRAMHVGGYGLGEIAVTKEIEESYEKEKKDDEEVKINVRYRPITETITYFGNSEQRREFSERCDGLRSEILTRHLIIKNWSRYMFNRENLTGLVEMYFGPVPSTEAINQLFNLPDRERLAEETEADVKLRHFGDRIEMAMRLYYINSLCQKPDRFLELRQTPGWQEFIFPPNTESDIIKKWIGEPDKWEPEDEGHRGKIRTRKMLAEENGALFADDDEKGENPLGYDKDKDERGWFTRVNIFAESNIQINEELNESIRKFIGGGKTADKTNQEEALAAQMIAYRLFKLWLMADEEGYEIYRNDDTEASLGIFDKKDLQFENGPAASDFGKLTAPSLYNLKNYRRELRRDFGPEGSFGKYERFCVSFFRLLKVPVQIEVGGEEKKEQRSFMELWWGYPEGEINKKTYPMEKALRLGDLPWKSLKDYLKTEMLTEDGARVLGLPWRGVHDEALANLYLTTFMAGRKDVGTYTLALRTQWSKDELFDPSFWLKLQKAIDVGIGDGVATFGRFRGMSKEKIGKQKREYKQSIIDAFWEGIASTVEYQKWESERVTIGKGITADEKMTVVKKIRKTAAKAGIQLKAIPATHKLPRLR